MKKLIVMVAAILSAAMISCSKSDNGDGGNNEPAETSMKVKVNDTKNEGFYKQYALKGVEGKPFDQITVGNYTPRGIQGELINVAITRTAAKVSMSYVNQGASLRADFALNAQGSPTKVDIWDVTPGYDPQMLGTWSFVYNANGLLERIYTMVEKGVDGDEEQGIPPTMVEVEQDFFRVTFAAGAKNWATFLLDSENEIETTCTASAKDNGPVDLNMVMWAMGIDDNIDFAILAGLFPSTQKLMESMSSEDYGDFTCVPTQKEGKYTGAKITVEGETFKDFSFEF